MIGAGKVITSPHHVLAAPVCDWQVGNTRTVKHWNREKKRRKLNEKNKGVNKSWKEENMGRGGGGARRIDRRAESARPRERERERERETETETETETGRQAGRQTETDSERGTVYLVCKNFFFFPYCFAIPNIDTIFNRMKEVIIQKNKNKNICLLMKFM